MDASPTHWPEATPENRPWTRWWWHGAAVDRQTITTLLETYRETGLGGVEITSIYGVKRQEDRNIEYLSPEWLDMLRHAIVEAHRLGMRVDLPPGSGWRIGGPFVTEDLAAARLEIDETAKGRSAQIVPLDEKVKRAGPGGKGLTFNPFSRRSLQPVIDHFTPALSGLGIRAMFHDSWEYESDACPEIFDRFLEKRGYSLEDHLAELSGDRGEEVQVRVKYDLQLTLSELALEDFIAPWAQWCREIGMMSRNQAHGSPGNLLDLYAAADIPETEVYRDITPDTPLVSKFASSAAHVAGRRVASSETGTWLKEHFHVSLADLKGLFDNLFVAGINHNVYHGTAFSPPDAPWPGWLFYASTQLNPQNPIWRDLGALNTYATRCQSVLQDGSPDNDLLVYWPIHDHLHNPTRKLAAKFAIAAPWLHETPAGDLFRDLWERGYAFDYVSDLQLTEATVRGERIVTPGAVYRALVIPPCQFMPLETLEALIEFRRQGATVLFAQSIPEDVPGFSNLNAKRQRFRELVTQLRPSSEIESDLADAGVTREPMVDHEGLLCIRRKHNSGHWYFIVNQGESPVDATTPLGIPWETVLMMDPMSGATGKVESPSSNPREVRIQLSAGESCVLKTFDSPTPFAEEWRYLTPKGHGHTLEGTWQVEFIAGGPTLPSPFETDELASWTQQCADAEAFAGTARYRIEFDAPTEADAWLLDLGEVHVSARVRLNDAHVATLIGPTFQTRIPALKPTGNVLEIEVTNLAANRIRHMDCEGIEWRIFEDINFIGHDPVEFDATDWPLTPSGLLGPVQIAPLS